MKTTTWRILILVALIALAIAYRPRGETVIAPTDDTIVEQGDNAMADDDDQLDAEIVVDEDDQQDDTVASGAAAQDDAENEEQDEETTTLNGYVPFEETQFETALEGEQNVALFFHAPWCPTCTALNQNIEQNEGTIADDTVVFKVDYDTATALKTKYGVTSQHTIVYVDSQGNAIKTERGAPSLEKVIEGFGA